MSGETTGQKIRRTYEAAGFTRASFAEASGLAYNTIHRWEDGESSPTLDNLERAADALGVHVTDLLSGNAAVSSAEARRLIVSLGERVNGQRGWRSALARAAGISPSFVSKIASGDAPRVNPAIVRRLARLHEKEGFPWDAAAVSVVESAGKPQPSRDPEIAAMQAIADLDDDARERVFAWMACRWPSVADVLEASR